jgi:hypothetical protein
MKKRMIFGPGSETTGVLAVLLCVTALAGYDIGTDTSQNIDTPQDIARPAGTKGVVRVVFAEEEAAAQTNSVPTDARTVVPANPGFAHTLRAISPVGKDTVTADLVGNAGIVQLDMGPWDLRLLPKITTTHNF